MKPNHVMTQVIPTPEEREFVEDRLYEHNREQTGQDDGALFGFFIHDESGEKIAGLTGWTWARACEIEQLWVHPNWRGQGYGTELLRAAEQYAREHGVEVIVIDSYSFQAPGFYQKHGYELGWVLEDVPPGHQWCFLVKRFGK